METEQLYLSVVMPAYNEQATIAEIIRRVLEIPNLLDSFGVCACEIQYIHPFWGKIVGKDNIKESMRELW